MPTKPIDKIVYSTQEIENLSFDVDFLTKVIQVMGYDGQNLQRQNASNMSLQLDYVGGTNPVYLGIAAPGTTTATAKWQIRKLTFDGNNNITKMEYSNGSSSFDQVWNDRAGLSYS